MSTEATLLAQFTALGGGHRIGRLARREAAIEAEVRAGVPLPQAMRDARLAGTEAR